ncbi:MAG: hypothetical protein IT450_11025 [Phycisphaerales bacterium]|nr:hypothetical protein [Phycisphaerales bacterium]
MSRRFFAIVASVCLVALGGGVQRAIHGELAHGRKVVSDAPGCAHACSSPAPGHSAPADRPHGSEDDCPTCIMLALSAAAPAVTGLSLLPGRVAPDRQVACPGESFPATADTSPRSTRGPPAA